MQFEIHPSIGIARVGNSPDQFYLTPDLTGGLPRECNSDGTPILTDEKPMPVSKFKDPQGRIRRQATRFRVFVYNEKDPNDSGHEAILGKDVSKLEWTVHIADKKAAWYNFFAATQSHRTDRREKLSIMCCSPIPPFARRRTRSSGMSPSREAERASKSSRRIKISSDVR